MNRKAKRVSKFFVVMFVFLLALALVLGSTGAYYRAMRRATGTIHLQKGIVVDYTGFSGDDVEWTGANATSFELFDERSAIPGEDINLVQTSIKADETSVNFYARAKIEYAFDGTNNGSPVSNIQNISNIPFSASDLITADVFASNWKQSASDEWNYFVSGNTYGTFVAGGAYTNIFKQGAKLSIEGTNFHGADDEGSGGGFVIAGTDYVITTIRASLVLEFIQANAGAVSDMNWNYVEQSEDPAPATYTDASGVTYTLNNEGTGYIVTGGIISQDGNGGSVSGYSAKVGNSSASAYESSYSYTILSYIHGLPVTEVAANAFAGNDAYISIVIPTTIVLIGEGAINIYGSVTFQTGRLNSITIRVNGIPTGTTLPNGSTFDGSEAVDVPELYTLTLIDEKDNYYSFWEDFINENGYTYQGNGTYTIRLPYGTVGQLPAPTFDGYTFQYWNDEADGVQLPANEDLTIEGDVTATAVYTENGQEPETYTVTLDGYWNDYANPSSTYYLEYDEDFDEFANEYGWTKYDNGEIFPSYSKTFASGSSFTLPTFTNDYVWAYDVDGNTTYVAGGTSYTVTSNITFYIADNNQSQDSYTVTLAFSDTSLVDSNFDSSVFKGWEATYKASPTGYTRTVEADTKITLPDDGKYTGYVWSADDGKIIVEPGDSYTVDRNITFIYQPEGSSSTGYTVTLAFADSKYMDNFDSSEFNDWTPLYDKYNDITGYYKDGLSDGDKIYLPDDGKNTGYVWAYTDNDKDYSLEPGSTYKVYGDIKFTYQGESSSSTYYTISLRFNDTSLIDNNFKSSAFDGWTPIDGKYGVEGYSMQVKSGTSVTLPYDQVDGYIWYYSNEMVSVNPGDSYTVNYDVTFYYQEGSASTDYQDVIIDLNGYYGYSTGNSWYMTLMMQGFQAYGMNQFKKTFTSTGSFTLPSITRDGYTLLGYTQGSSMYYPGMNMLYSAGSTQMVMMLSGGTTYYYAQWQQGAGGTLTLNSSMMSYIDSSVWVPEFEALGWTNNGSNVYMTSEDPILLPKVSVNYNGQTKIVSYYNTSPMGGGMGTTYYPGQTYTPAGNSTLYIYWTDGATLTLYNEFDQELGHEWNYGSTSFTEGDPNYVSYVGGGSVELPSPTLDGYTFAYWQGSNGDLYAPGATYSLNGNNTLTAVWFSGTTYTVTLDVTNSGVDDESRFNWTGYYSNITKNSYQYQIVVEENDTITLPTSAYYLGSWVDSNDGSHSESMGATYQVTSDITFNFNYTGDVTRYTLTLNFQTDYDNNGDRYAWNSPYNYFNPGSLSFDGNYIYHEDEENAVITLPTAKVYSNRLIQGYFNTDEYGKGDSYQLGDIITLTDNITLYFISTGYEEYCTITLYTNGHLDLISNYDGWELYGNDLVKSVTSGTTITLPTSSDPRVCWDRYDAGAEYYVEWSTSFSLQLRELYTATLNLNGNGAQITDGLSAWEDQGEGIYTKQVKEDVEFNLPTLESSYYWHYEYDGEEYYRTGEVNIREDITFTLVYVQSYTATLHLNGLTPNDDGYSDFWNNFTNNGDGTYSRSFNIVGDWDLPGDWYFNSDSSNRLYWWFTDSECTNPVYDREDWAEGFTSDVDFYATSGQEQITVYFNANGGTIDNNNFTYSGGVYGYNTYYSSEIYSDAFVAPTKEGYTFLGWYTNDSFTGINYSELVQYLYDYEDEQIRWSVFGNGATLYAKYSENYVYSNVVYSWNEDDNNWSVVGVTDEFNAETLTIESSIDDGAGHSGNVVKIANSAFAGRKIAQSGKKGGPEYENVYYSFAEVVIPATIVEIGDRAFYYNSDLTTVTFAQNLALTTIGSEAFAECLIPSFNIPASVTSIGEAAFDDCPLLTGITVDENNQVYSSYYGVVYNKDQTEIKIMTEGLTGIDGTVKIPATVTTINKAMDGSFVNLVFEGDITFKSVRSYYRGEACWNDSLDSLATITFTNTDPSTLGKVYNCDDDSSYIVFVPEDSVDAYNSFFSDHDNMRNWTAVSVSEKDSINPTNILLDGVEYDDDSECYTYVDSIGIVYHLNQDGKTYTLYDATNADFSSYGEWDHLEINKTGPYNMFDITAIAENAFKNVSAAFCIEFADSVKTIGAYAFYNCTMINLASSICSDVIGEYAFYNVGSQRDSSPELYLKAMGNQTIGAHAFDGAKANRIEFTGEFNNITVSIGEYAFANNPSSVYINFGDYNNIITYNIAANAFNGTEISNFQLGNNDYEDGSRGLTFNFATDSLNGADINEIYSYFPNTIISGLENSGISSSTVIKMPTDELVDTMAALLPSNTVKNYYRYDREDYTDSSGVVYRCMPRPGGNFYNYEYMLYSVPSSLEGTYTVPETINGSTIYGIWPGAFDDTQLTAVNFSVKANTDGGRAIVKTFANLPTTNANSQTITYGMFASLYEVISSDSNFSSYTVEEIEEPHKLVIDADENYYFGDMSDYSYGYINDLGTKYYKPFTSTTPSFTIPYHNGNYGENYELTFTVYVWNENGGYWENTGDTLQGGATFNPADYSSDVRLNPNWNYVEQNYGNSYITVYVPNEFDLKGWTSEYDDVTCEYIMTYECYYDGSSTTVYLPTEKNGMSKDGYSFEGWYSVDDWNSEYGRPNDGAKSVDSVKIDATDQYYEFYGYWVK